MPVTPFVVGQWVRGEKFYGRDALIEEILRGPRNWLWLLGTRRIGKTSLLKQIEHVTSKTPDAGYFPIFWDFQGASDPEELHNLVPEGRDALDSLRAELEEWERTRAATTVDAGSTTLDDAEIEKLRELGYVK